jgi:hypothetical protein
VLVGKLAEVLRESTSLQMSALARGEGDDDVGHARGGCQTDVVRELLLGLFVVRLLIDAAASGEPSPK